MTRLKCSVECESASETANIRRGLVISMISVFFLLRFYTNSSSHDRNCRFVDEGGLNEHLQGMEGQQ